MSLYIALLRKESESSFGVEFPDFPGCITVGDTLDEAATNAREALALHIEGMVDDGEPLPEPTKLEDIMDTDEGRTAQATLVVLAPAVKQPVVRINITIDKGLLDAVDRAAKIQGFTRSGFLAEAARSRLG